MARLILYQRSTPHSSASGSNGGSTIWPFFCDFQICILHHLAVTASKNLTPPLYFLPRLASITVQILSSSNLCKALYVAEKYHSNLETTSRQSPRYQIKHIHPSIKNHSCNKLPFIRLINDNSTRDIHLPLRHYYLHPIPPRQNSVRLKDPSSTPLPNLRKHIFFFSFKVPKSYTTSQPTTTNPHSRKLIHIFTSSYPSPLENSHVKTTQTQTPNRHHISQPTSSKTKNITYRWNPRIIRLPTAISYTTKASTLPKTQYIQGSKKKVFSIVVHEPPKEVDEPAKERKIRLDRIPFLFTFHPAQKNAL